MDRPGLLLWRLTFRAIRAAGIPAGEGEILEALDELKLGRVADQARGRLRSGRWVLEQHDALAERWRRALDLDTQIPTERASRTGGTGTPSVF
jgi:hypothetical protein